MQKNVSKKSIQYPAQTGPYKIFVKDKSIWQNYSVARLQISVGNPKHEGDKFFALTEWAAARFDKVILIVSDTLQRYNIAIQNDISMIEAHKLSLLNGKKWLQTNQRAIQNISSDACTISFWDEWLSHSDYEQAYTHIKKLFLGNHLFQTAVEEMAILYCCRNLEKNDIDYQSRLKTSVDYILEELAAFAVMFNKEKAVDIYPGSWFKDLFQIIETIPSSGLLSGFSSTGCVRVDFVKNKV